LTSATPSTSTMSADSFAALGVPGKLVQSLRNSGIDSPFPIQTATLPDSLAGRDVLGRGRTGSGKTVAFSLPTVVRLSESKGVRKPGAPRALILVPTRELAAQVNETIAPLAKAMNMTTLVVVGGVKINPQINALRNGVDILVATPGRLEDLMKQRFAKLDQVEVTVLDEADHMADLGFLPIVKRLLDATPKNGQRLLFSATIDASVDVLVKRYLSSPVTHSVDSAESPVPAMTHHVMNVTSDHKPSVVKELVSGEGRTLAFTRTKYGAKKLARQLTAAGIPAVDLHGNLSQNARVRNLAAFSDGSVRVLVATDIAARGIHVDGVSLVVHVDPPAEHKAYLHRSGRTARAGAEGIVITVGTPDQRNDVRSLMKLAAISPTMHSVIPGDEVIRSLVGPAAPFVKPTPVQIESADAPRRPIAPRGGARKTPARPKAQQGRRR
jgi:superfamily II DNA/RNA helicase